MKYFSPLFGFLMILSLSWPVLAADSCRQHLISIHGTTTAAVESSLKQEVEAFRTLAERALTLRAETIKVGTAIKEKLDRGRPLTGDDLALINTGINEHLALRTELLAAAEAHEC